MLLVVLKRTVALFFVFFAVHYWAQIVGLANPGRGGITTMSEHWQIASVILAVTMPVAAIGLWGLFAWGTSTWLAVIILELVMLTRFSDPFSIAAFMIWFHVACMGIYITIKFGMMIRRRRKLTEGVRTN